jgi:hypothetical protein
MSGARLQNENPYDLFVDANPEARAKATRAINEAVANLYFTAFRFRDLGALDTASRDLILRQVAGMLRQPYRIIKPEVSQ